MGFGFSFHPPYFKHINRIDRLNTSSELAEGLDWQANVLNRRGGVPIAGVTDTIAAVTQGENLQK
jgi:hypothetical protein